MGASSSRSAVAPILPASALSASQVAEAVHALGESYIPYVEKLQKDGIDGGFLEAVTADDLPGMLADIGVTSGLHQKKLGLVFYSFKSGGNADIGSLGDIAETPHARPSKIVKAFAGFLSHYKLECGTEARLVQQNLRPIIELLYRRGATAYSCTTW